MRSDGENSRITVTIQRGDDVYDNFQFDINAWLPGQRPHSGQLGAGLAIDSDGMATTVADALYDAACYYAERR